MNAPDRPIPGYLQRVRSLARGLRMVAIRLRSHCLIKTGANVWFGAGSVIAAPDFIRTGSNVAFGRNFHLEANLTVGDDVLVSSCVAIVGNDHPFDDPNSTVFAQGRSDAAHVVIEGNNLIGFGCVIIGDVTIGEGCIVGARSVVTRDLPPYTVCVGTPARPLRPRFSEPTVATPDRT